MILVKFQLYKARFRNSRDLRRKPAIAEFHGLNSVPFPHVFCILFKWGCEIVLLSPNRRPDPPAVDVKPPGFVKNMFDEQLACLQLLAPILFLNSRHEQSCELRIGERSLQIFRQV